MFEISTSSYTLALPSHCVANSIVLEFIYLQEGSVKTAPSY